MEAPKIHSRRRFFSFGLIIGTAVALLMSILFNLEAFDFLENRSVDWRFLIRGEIKAHPKIVIIEIDENSFSALNRKWPWPRTYFARIIDRVSKAGARVIGFDIIMSEPSIKAHDRDLARSAKNAGNVIFPSKFEETGQRISVNEKNVELREELLKEPISALMRSGEVGFLNLPHDSDGFVRRFTPIRSFQGKPHVSFDMKIIARFLEVPSARLAYIPYEALSIKDRTIPLNHYDSSYINFAGPSGAFEKLSFHKVLKNEFPPGFFDGKIVLIGATFLDSKDFFPTPFLETEKGNRRFLSGIEVHANTIHTVLSNRSIRQLPLVYGWLIILIGGVLLTLLTLRVRPVKGAILVAAAVISYFTLTAWLFQKDILIPATAPVLTFGSVFFSQVVFRYFTEEKEKRRIRSMFQRYVSPEVVEKLIRDPEGLHLGGKKQHLTVLFSDIKDFTSISEKMAPEEILSLLNQYLTVMTTVVLKNGGMLDKYVGDAVMAVFGAPLEIENHALVACKTALEMLEELKSLQNQWEMESKPILDIRIGINTGEMVIGNVGSPERMDYTVIGDNVNLASRLEGINKEFGTHIIISHSTFAMAKDHIRAKDLGHIKIKGKEIPVLIYELLCLS